MKKFLILLVSIALMLLVIGAVSAEEGGNQTPVNNPITTLLGGLSVSDDNTATISFFGKGGKAISSYATVSVNGKPIDTSGQSVSISVSLPSDTATMTISNGAASASVAKSDSATSGSIHTDVNQNKKAFSVILKDKNGNPVKNQEVTVSVNGISKTVTTDGSGKVLVSVAISSKVKSADISYSGTAKEKQASPQGKSNSDLLGAAPDDGEDSAPAKIASKIKVSKQTFNAKTKTKKVTVVLKDKSGKVLKSKKVTLKVRGKIYAAKTNSNGKAVFKVKNLNKKGVFKGVVSFNGDSVYDASSDSFKIVVKK
jgi:hypothetical protein